MKYLLIAVGVISLFGCDVLRDRVEARDPALTLLTGRIIHQFIENSSNPKDRAESIIRSCTIIKKEIQFDKILSFEELREALIKEIPKEKLLPGEALLIEGLINEIVSEVEQKAIEKYGEKFEESKTTLLYFLGIAIDTAEYSLTQ